MELYRSCLVRVEVREEDVKVVSSMCYMNCWRTSPDDVFNTNKTGQFSNACQRKRYHLMMTILTKVRGVKKGSQ